MSTPVAASPPVDSHANDNRYISGTSVDELSELVDQYVVADFLPSTEWLTRLGLARPRENIRCLDPWTRFNKRAFDVCIAGVGLILLSPVMLLTAILVKLTSPGSAIFRQERIGLNQRGRKRNVRRKPSSELPAEADRRSGQDRRKQANFAKPFVLYKFRTMRDDAEKHGPQFATKGDPRVTPIGRFLRKTRLDELPQLWNVLRGEMSLVGPRPERSVFIVQLSKEIPEYVERLGLKPGLTGLAQVTNGYDNDIEGFRRKVTLDLLYLQNCCLWNDTKILFRTIGVVLTGKGAL